MMPGMNSAGDANVRGPDPELQKRVDKLQRVVLVESKEIKGLKDDN
jgi:hypothetical protein